MTQIIPLQAVPNQTASINLGNQAVTLNVYQRSTGLYVDVFLGNTPTVIGVIAQHANRIVREAYFGFVGDLAFFDSMGKTDPTYEGIGSRYFLAYLTDD